MQSLLQSNILVGVLSVGEVSRKVFTSLASRVEDIGDTLIAIKYSTVIFCGTTAGNSSAVEDLLYSKHSLHAVGIQLGLQVLTTSITEKLTTLIAGKQFSEADKLVFKSLQNVLDNILPSSSSGIGSFRLSSLINSDPLGQPPQLTHSPDTSPPLHGAKLVTTRVLAYTAIQINNNFYLHA